MTSDRDDLARRLGIAPEDMPSVATWTPCDAPCPNTDAEAHGGMVHGMCYLPEGHQGEHKCFFMDTCGKRWAPEITNN